MNVFDGWTPGHHYRGSGVAVFRGPLGRSPKLSMAGDPFVLEGRLDLDILLLDSWDIYIYTWNMLIYMYCIYIYIYIPLQHFPDWG